MEMEQLRFPIGRFEPRPSSTEEEVRASIDRIQSAPARLAEAVGGLSDAQLDTRYRPDGWTLRQVVHHVPESHMNSYIRIKWALTEDEPLIKVYEEAKWAELADYQLTPVELSLDFLALIHAKWTVLLRSLSPEQWSRRFVHPEWGAVALAWSVGNYAWHGRHHLAHITGTIECEGW